MAFGWGAPWLPYPSPVGFSAVKIRQQRKYEGKTFECSINKPGEFWLHVLLCAWKGHTTVMWRQRTSRANTRPHGACSGVKTTSSHIPFTNKYCWHYSPAQETGAVHRQSQTFLGQSSMGQVLLLCGEAGHSTTLPQGLTLALHYRQNMVDKYALACAKQSHKIES